MRVFHISPAPAQVRINHNKKTTSCLSSYLSRTDAPARFDLSVARIVGFHISLPCDEKHGERYDGPEGHPENVEDEISEPTTAVSSLTSSPYLATYKVVR